MDNNVLKALATCPLFAGMDFAEIERIMGGAVYRIVDFSKNEIYTLAGTPCLYADIVVSGELICRMTSFSGKQVEVSRLSPGDIVAPAFIFARNNAMPVSVETHCRVLILRMKPTILKELIDNNEQLRMNFIRILSEIDVFLTQKMKVLSLFTVREKVAYLLLEEAGKQGSATIRLDKSRQEIANSFGIQKYSLLRVLSEMETDGIIRIDGKTITILDRGRL